MIKLQTELAELNLTFTFDELHLTSENICYIILVIEKLLDILYEIKENNVQTFQ
jgi:hypothetical protein